MRVFGSGGGCWWRKEGCDVWEFVIILSFFVTDNIC